MQNKLEDRPSLIIAPRLTRDSDFYTPLINTIKDQSSYSEVSCINFPGHDDGEMRFSFEGSIDVLEQEVRR